MNLLGPLAKALDVLVLLADHTVPAHDASSSASTCAGDAHPVFGRRSVQRAVGGQATEHEVQVVLEGHADPAVELHALLEQLRPVLAHEGLRGARQFAAVGVTHGHRRGRLVADRMAGLEPGRHHGEPVLERLVRGERTAERIAVEGPLDGHVERGLHRADRLGVGQHQRVEELALHVLVGLADLAHDRVGRHPHVVERHPREPPGQVHAVHRRDRETRCVGGHEHLGQARRRSVPPPAGGWPRPRTRPGVWPRAARPRPRRP